MGLFSLYLVAFIAACCSVANGAVTFTQSTPFAGTVSENESNQVVFSGAQATSDQGRSVSYTLLNGNGQVQSIATITNGVIILTSPLDYETTTSEVFTVIANDGVDSVTTTFTLVVTNVNDNAPSFTQNTYTGDVAQAGTFMNPVTVVATDADRVDNGVTYAITGGNSGNYFTINSATGQITQRAVVDPQTFSAFVLTVLATDAGTPAQSNTATVVLSVDQNTYVCPNWMTRFGSKCYKLVKGAKTYDRAQSTCVRYGTISGLGNGNLATVYDSFRQDFVVNTLMRPRMSVWIGLNDKNVEGTWVWEAADYSYSYTNWAVMNSVQQPAGGTNQNCVAIEARQPRTGMWNDFRCEMETWSVCQFPAEIV